MLQILKLPTQQIYLTYSKLNMDEVCGLKSHLLHTSQIFLLKSIHATLLVSRSECQKDKPFLLTDRRKNFVIKTSFLLGKIYFPKKPLRMEGFHKYFF